MKTTFSRTFFPAAIILLVALLLVGTVFQAIVRDFMADFALNDLKNDAELISQLASAYYSNGTMSNQDFLVNLSVASKVSGVDTVICNAWGQLALCSDAPLGCEHQGLIIQDQAYIQSILESGCVTGSGVTIKGVYSDPRYVAGVPVMDAFGSPIGIVIASMPMTQTTAVMDKFSDIFLLVSLLVVLAAMIMIHFIARYNANPLRQMARAASAFGHGKLDARVRIDENTSEEVQELALAFNNMAASLQKSEYQRQEFVANVSHELKTPMTTIGGYVDGILDGTIPPERQTHYLTLVSSEVKRLSRLVRSMLEISRLQDQGGIPEEQKLRFDLCECAGQALITFEQKILAKSLDVEVVFPEHPAYTFANADAITQVIYNLLDNAVKFCPEGGKLGLQVQLGSEKLYLTVSNSGQTIPPEELPLVFDRFHKTDKSRSQNRDGWGLGLYIVKTIICSHGEDISVRSQDGMTEFTFTLPLIN